MNKILDFSPPVEIEIPGPLWLSFPEFSPQEKTDPIGCSGGQTFTS